MQISEKINNSPKNKVRKASVDDIMFIGRKVGSAYYVYWMSFTELAIEVQKKSSGITSVDGVFNSGGNVDFVGTKPVVITPNDLNNTVTFVVQTAIPNSGDSTHVSTAGQIYDWTIGDTGEFTGGDMSNNQISLSHNRGTDRPIVHLFDENGIEISRENFTVNTNNSDNQVTLTIVRPIGVSESVKYRII